MTQERDPQTMPIGPAHHRRVLKQVRDLGGRARSLERQAARPTAGTKAGIPSDADYATAPPIGTLVIDTVNSRLYVRTAAATWKYTALT